MDTDTSIPILTTATVAGEAVAFHRPSIGQLSEIVPLIAPFLSDLLNGETTFDLSVFLHCGDDLCRAVSLATNTEKAWVEDLQFEDFLTLLNALLNAYTDFLRKVSISFPGQALPPSQTAKLEG